MSHIGFKDSISSWNREFFVNTNFNEETNGVVIKVSENSHLLNTYNFILKESLSLTEIETKTKEKHKSIFTDWELLFYIHNKVKKSNHASSLNKMGLILMNRNLFPEAFECFKMAIDEDQNFIDSYINLGKAYLKAEIYPEAIEVLTKAIEKSPDFADIYSHLGIAHLKSKNYQKAIDSLEKAIEINPKYDKSHFMIGMAYLFSIVIKVDASEMIPVSIRQKKILTHLQKAMDLNPYFEDIDVRQAMKEIQDDNHSEALELLEKIETKLKSEGENYIDDEFYLSFMFGGKSKDDQVISGYINLLQQKAEEKPNYADLHNNLGVAYLIQCRNMFLKALGQFRVALKINPKFKNAKKNLKLAENEGKGFIILLRALLK